MADGSGTAVTLPVIVPITVPPLIRSIPPSGEFGANASAVEPGERTSRANGFNWSTGPKFPGAKTAHPWVDSSVPVETSPNEKNLGAKKLVSNGCNRSPAPGIATDEDC